MSDIKFYYKLCTEGSDELACFLGEEDLLLVGGEESVQGFEPVTLTKTVARVGDVSEENVPTELDYELVI